MEVVAPEPGHFLNAATAHLIPSEQSSGNRVRRICLTIDKQRVQLQSAEKMSHVTRLASDEWAWRSWRLSRVPSSMRRYCPFH